MNVLIRGVPTGTHAVLRRRAAAAGQSLQEYVLALLNEHAAKPTVTEWLAEARALAHEVDDRGSIEEIVAMIREDRDSH